MVNLCKNRVRLGSKKIRVRLVAGTTLRGYDLTSILGLGLCSQGNLLKDLMFERHKQARG